MILNEGAKEAPKSFSEALDKLAGRDPSGRFPILRVVWAPDRMVTVRGKLVPLYAKKHGIKLVGYRTMGDHRVIAADRLDELAEVPKNEIVLPIYRDVWQTDEVWVCEVWERPENLAPYWNEQWRYKWENGERVDMLGEPPTEGDYMHVKYLRNAKGEPLEPGEEVYRTIEGWWQACLADPLAKAYWERRPATSKEIQDATDAYMNKKEEWREKRSLETKDMIKSALDPAKNLLFNPKAGAGQGRVFHDILKD